MGYIESILEPGERICFRGELHRSLYFFAGVCLPTALAFGVLAWAVAERTTMFGIGLLAGLALAIFLFGLVLAINSWSTEIAVTNRRVLIKTGLIARSTSEMNLSKIEGVDVRQSVLGRLLGFGTVTVRGTGSGLTPFRFIANPLDFRRAILSS